MVTLTWFSVALAFMLGMGGATFGTIVLFYDLLGREFLTEQERTTGYVRTATGFALALVGASVVAVVGPGLCRGCP